MVSEIELWDPFRKKKSILGEFDDFFSCISIPTKFSINGIARQPLIDVKENGKNFEIKAELPGIEKKDLKVKIGEQLVSLSASTKTEKGEKSKGFYYSERAKQSFYRSFSLPKKINPKKAKVEFKNGLLEIVAPKK